jgi:glutathione S-transferase
MLQWNIGLKSQKSSRIYVQSLYFITRKLKHGIRSSPCRSDYRLEQSRSQRIIWLLEELKLDYNLEIFHRDMKTRLAPPELKKIHPLGKSPVISITPPGSTKPVIVAESALIIEYLLEHFGRNDTGRLLPKQWKDGQEGKVCGETETWMRYKYFLHYGEGSLMTLMLVSLVAGSMFFFSLQNPTVLLKY